MGEGLLQISSFSVAQTRLYAIADPAVIHCAFTAHIARVFLVIVLCSSLFNMLNSLCFHFSLKIFTVVSVGLFNHSLSKYLLCPVFAVLGTGDKALLGQPQACHFRGHSGALSRSPLSHPEIPWGRREAPALPQLSASPQGSAPASAHGQGFTSPRS